MGFTRFRRELKEVCFVVGPSVLAVSTVLVFSPRETMGDGLRMITSALLIAFGLFFVMCAILDWKEKQERLRRIEEIEDMRQGLHEFFKSKQPPQG